jgi:hypothetical protein
VWRKTLDEKSLFHLFVFLILLNESAHPWVRT